jgi:rhamnosyltransferase
MSNSLEKLTNPKCIVLLATYNGDCWLHEQLSTIYDQKNVSVRVVASDDKSTDNTLLILKYWAEYRGLEQLPSIKQRQGSANRNFLRLIRDVDIGFSEFIALADQDDIWYPDKLSRAISCLKATGADAYSSNIEAFWSDGRVCVIRKSHSMKAWDYLFSSPGPGCTFVFQRSAFLNLRAWVRKNFEELSKLWVHDWIFYAYLRSVGYRWLIDDHVSISYRQHASNEIGANIGLLALKNRLEYIRSGKYRNNVLSVSRLVGAPTKLVQALERMSLRDRLWLLSHAYQFRRSFMEVLIIAFLFILMK